jgi:hypothetical protein
MLAPLRKPPPRRARDHADLEEDRCCDDDGEEGGGDLDHAGPFGDGFEIEREPHLKGDVIMFCLGVVGKTGVLWCSQRLKWQICLRSSWSRSSLADVAKKRSHG